MAMQRRSIRNAHQTTSTSDERAATIAGVVADTSALVSLGVPRAASDYDTDSAPNLLQYLLTSCEVVVPPEVVTELTDIARYHEIHDAAAHNVLAAQDHYTITDPYQQEETPDSRPMIEIWE
jgi:hypothetical protein